MSILQLSQTSVPSVIHSQHFAPSKISPVQVYYSFDAPWEPRTTFSANHISASFWSNAQSHHPIDCCVFIFVMQPKNTLVAWWHHHQWPRSGVHSPVISFAKAHACLHTPHFVNSSTSDEHGLAWHTLLCQTPKSTIRRVTPILLIPPPLMTAALPDILSCAKHQNPQPGM